MTVKESILKIIALAVCGAVLIISMVAFKIDTYAAETTTVTITGEELQALLISGQWEATYMANGSTHDTMNIGSTIDQNAVVLISDVPTPVIHFTEASMKFGSTIDYSNVVSFKIIFGGLANLTTPGTSYTTLPFNYAYGYLLGSTRVDLPRNSSPGSYGSGTIPIYNNYTSSYNNAPLFVLSSSFEPMRLNEFIISTDTLNVGSSTSQTNYIINNIKIAVKSIEITFENLSDTEVIKNQLEIANEYLEEITNSSSDDVLRIDDIEKEFSEVQDNAEEYNEVMDSVETPEAEEVIPEDSVADILDDENVSEGQPYIFSILESLQSITWILTMILISVVVGIIKYIIYGKS